MTQKPAKYKYKVILASATCTMKDTIFEITASCIMLNHTIHYLRHEHEDEPFITCCEHSAIALIEEKKIPSIIGMQKVVVEPQAIASH